MATIVSPQQRVRSLTSPGDTSPAWEHTRTPGLDQSLHEPRSRLLLYALAIGLVVVALVLYQPWVEHPFPLRDFSLLLYLMAPTAEFREAYDAVMVANTAQGRFQPVLIAAFALQWKLFGANPLLWQIVRFFLMLGLFALTFRVARRFGAAPVAALLAAGLIVTASGAQESWYMMQVAEPFAVLFFLAALLVTASSRLSHRPVVAGVLIGAALAISIAIKETMIATVPFAFVVASGRWDPEGWRWEGVGRRALVRVAVASAVVLCAVWPIVSIRLGTTANSYAGRYDLDGIGWARISNAARAIILPATRVPYFPASAVLLVLIALGWWGVLRDRSRRRHAVALAVGIAVLIAAGVAVYAPWPSFPGYYALPFFTGIVLAVAVAYTELLRSPNRVVRWAAAAGALFVIGQSGLLAWNEARADGAIRRTDWQAAELVGRVDDYAALIAAVPDPAMSGSVALGLQFYARAFAGSPPGSVKDVSCEEASRLINSPPPQSIVMTFSHMCGSLGQVPSTRQVSNSYTELDWRFLRPRTVAVTAAFWMESQ